MKVNREVIKSKGLNLITPVLITNPDRLKSMSSKKIDIIAGETTIIECNI